ncbi:MAG: MFS transporter [Candidatus Daviesbacteria bacterium]|nr:MFS transporter [Candidatus Daviesbacteria bacterium]
MNTSRNIKLIYLINFLLDFRFYAPIMIIYLSQITGSFALAMSVFSAVTISSALFEVPTGVFSDFLGRRGTLIIGAAFGTLAGLSYALGFAYWVLLLGGVFEGISRSFFSGNNDALLYDSIDPDKRETEYPHLLGKTSSMFQLALAISATIGGLIAQNSLNLVVWLSVIPQFICFLVSFWIIEPKVHYQKSTNIYSHLTEAIWLFIKNPKLRWLTLADMIDHGIGEAAWLFKSAFIQLWWPFWAIGIAQTLANGGAFISFYFSGKLIKRFGEFRLLIIGNIYSKISNFTALLFPSILSPAIMSTSSLFYGVVQTSKNTLLQKEFTDHQRASMSSLNSLAINIFLGVFAVILGAFADKFGPTNALIFAFILALPALLIYIKLFRENK